MEREADDDYDIREARKKQMARIEKNFLLDPNYGLEYLRKMKVNMEDMARRVEQPFYNMFYAQGAVLLEGTTEKTNDSTLAN